MEKLSDHLHISPMGRIIEENKAIERDRSFNAMLEETQRREEAAKKRKTYKRLYSAANHNRTHSTWTTSPYSANYSLRCDLRALRARAREMCANAPHFRNFLNLAKSNVVGSTGLKLQCEALLANKEPNTRVNELVENAFWQWSHRETCSVTGKINWIAAQRLFVETLCRDGEVLVQHIAAANEFGYSLKFWNVDYLDETYNEQLRNGSRVIMSVEVDANDKPVAYWLTTPPSDGEFVRPSQRYRTRVPADQMTHAGMITDEETQTRYVTFFSAVLLEGKNLERYKEGVITSARFAANAFGFLETTVADETQYNGQDIVNGSDATDEVQPQDRKLEISADMLEFNELPPGMKMNQFDPKQPTQMHTEFKTTILMDIAAGLGLNYFSLAGDMSAVNFSSSRIGLAAERDIWKSLQEFVSQTLCRDVYHKWLESCMLNGRLKLAAREYKELQNPVWQGRGWPYLDPLKDVNASSIAIANGLSTYTKELAVLGIDFEDHLKEKAREQKMMDKANVQLEIVSVGAKTADEPDEETDNDTPTKAPKSDDDRGYTNGRYRDEPLM